MVFDNSLLTSWRAFLVGSALEVLSSLTAMVFGITLGAPVLDRNQYTSRCQAVQLFHSFHPPHCLLAVSKESKRLVATSAKPVDSYSLRRDSVLGFQHGV